MEREKVGGRRKRNAARVVSKEDVEVMKCTFVIEAELDTKLDYHAKRVGKSRSAVVNDLVKQATAYIRIQCVGLNKDAAPVDDATDPPATSTAA